MAGRPVPNLSLALNYATGGLNVGGYHWMNIGIHVCCAMLLYAILVWTIRGPRFPQHLASGARAIAFTAAILWLLHPLQTEVVDYVTQRTESMMAAFLLITLYAAVRARRSTQPAWWSVVAVAACALGMASKASMVAAPLVVLLYDRAFEDESLSAALRGRPALYAGLASTWLLLGGLLWTAPRSTVGTSETVSWQMYALNQAPIAAGYLRRAVWPEGLVLDYGVPHPLLVRDIWPSAALIGALVLAAVIAWRRNPAAGFPGLVFFIMLAPTSSVIPITTEVGAERRMYVPMMALLALAVVAGWRLLDRLVRAQPTMARPLAVAAGVVVAGVTLGCAALTVTRNALFNDPVALWRDSVNQRPHPRARISLASALVSAGKTDEAISELRLADSDYPDAKFALGSTLYATGRADEALSVLQDFIALNPSDPSRIPSRSLVGKLLLSRKDYEAAAAQFTAILHLRASDREAQLGLAEAHRGLAEVAWERGDAAETIRQAEAAIASNARDASAHNLLGVVLASSDRLGEAVAHFREAYRIDPTYTRARENLSRAERELSR